MIERMGVCNRNNTPRANKRQNKFKTKRKDRSRRMNSNDRTFSKFVKKTAGAGGRLPTETDEYGLEEQDDNRYRAFRLGQSGRPQLRLRLYAENGVVSLMTYAYLTEVVSGSHQYLTLVFTNCL